MKHYRLLSGLTLILLLSMITGCVSNPSNPNASTWKLPKKSNPEAAMIIGRFGQPSNLPDNPDNVVREVFFFNRMSGVYFGGHGERNYVMDNGYFVVTDLRPGKYYTRHFVTKTGNYRLPLEKDDTVEVKAGQILFFGSYDFITNEMTWLQNFKNKGTYDIKRADHPTEMELLQWLKKSAAGSGWEQNIDKRIRNIAGK